MHGLSGELWDIEAEFEVGNTTALGLPILDKSVNYVVANETLNCLGKTVALKPVQGRVKLRLLLDRTSQEVFGNDGQVSLTSCFLPSLQDKALSVYSEGSMVKLLTLIIHPLRSAWQAAKTP